MRRRCLLIAVWAIGLAPVAMPTAARALTPPPAGSAVDRDADHVDDDLEHDLAATPGVHDTPVIVTFDESVDASLLRSVDRSVGEHVDVDQRYHNIAGIATELDDHQIDALADNPAVARIEADRTVTLPPDDGLTAPATAAARDGAQAAPATTASPLELASGPEEADPGYAAGVAAAGVDGDAAGDGATVYGPDDVVVGLIDSGIDVRHVDLDGGKVLHSEDFTDRDPACEAPPARAYDDLGHGTHVAATIAGTGEGNARYRGIAPAAALVNLKVFDCHNGTPTSVIDAALDWAITNRATYGIDVLNLSLGGSGYELDGTDSTSRLVNRAVASGIVVVVAAGNSGDHLGTVGTPGVAAQAITVGAIRSGAGGSYLATFSSRGPTYDSRIKPDVVAPGVDIVSASHLWTVVGDYEARGYIAMSGTSMATPFVAGLSGLMLQADPSLRPGGSACAPGDVTGDCADGVYDASMTDGVRDLLRSTAQDWADPGPDPETGWGRVRVYDALAAAAQVEAPGPEYPTVASRTASVDAASHPSDWWSLDLAAGVPTAVIATIPDANGFTGPFLAVELYDASGAPLPTEMACTGWCYNRSTGTFRGGGWYVVPESSGRYWVRIHAVAGGATYRLDVSGAVAVAPTTSAVSVEREGASTVLTEGGASTATLRVAMPRAPVVPTTVHVVTDGQLSATPSTLVFAPGSGATPQTVTVAAVADAAAEGLHAGTVEVSVDAAALGDAGFAATTVPISDPREPAPGPVTRRVSLRPDGSESDGPPVAAEDGAFVGDLGRWVAFTSAAADLVPGDTNGMPDVFVRDLGTGTTVRASVSATGQQLRAGTRVLGVSADGRRVLFMGWPGGDDTVAGDTNNDFDLFVRDLDAQTTQRVDLTSAGGQMPKQPGAYAEITGALSADGRFVVFETKSRMTPDDNDDTADAYVRDLLAGTTELVSIAGNGDQGTGGTGVRAVDVSADGRFVLFTSDADGLAPGERPGALDAFLRDRVAGTTTLVSVDPDGAAAVMDGDYSSRAVLSRDGGHVAFETSDADQPWVLAGVYVRDVAAGTTRRASVSDGGDGLAAGTHVAGISGDGRFVTFATSEDATGDGSGGTFRRDLELGHTQRLAVDRDGAAIGARRVGTSDGGRAVVFSSDDANVVTGDRNHNDDVFVRPYVHPLGEVPAAPADLTADPGDGVVTLHWRAVPGADDYVVDAGGDVITTADTTLRVDGLANDVPLTLGVAARIDGITSAPVTVGATPHRAGPPAPAWLGAAPGNRGVRLAWLLVPGASFYTVTVGTSTVLTTATSVNVGNLRNGVTLVAQVTATVAGIVSPPRSITVTPRLPAPASLQGSGSGSGVTLRWARVVGASGYVVSGDGVASRWVGATATTFSGLDARSRTFLVRAADATDRSGPSPAVTVRTLTRPARLAATPGTGRLTVTWGAVTGATGYLIWRDNVATPVRTTSRTVVLGGLARGSRHTVRVAAVTANSTSERSSVVASAR